MDLRIRRVTQWCKIKKLNNLILNLILIDNMSTNIKLEKFLTTSKEVHGDKYDYSRVVIENSLGIKDIKFNNLSKFFQTLRVPTKLCFVR